MLFFFVQMRKGCGEDEAAAEAAACETPTKRIKLLKKPSNGHVAVQYRSLYYAVLSTRIHQKIVFFPVQTL